MAWWRIGSKKTAYIGSLEVRLAALEQSQQQLHRSIEEIKALVSDTAALVSDTAVLITELAPAEGLMIERQDAAPGFMSRPV